MRVWGLFFAIIVLGSIVLGITASLIVSPPFDIAMSPEEANRKGEAAFDRKDYVAALGWYRKAANRGYALAQRHIGSIYRDGLGVRQDYAQAAVWYRKAADQGEAVSQTNMGWIYENGLGVTQDYGQALSWYRKAADQGDSDAQVNLGSMYDSGEGVTQDYGQALIWFRKAADQETPSGQRAVGWMFHYGHGVKQDYAEAMKWYQKAAVKDEAWAQNNIGSLYESGHGVKLDYAQALAWYRKAADQGNATAEANIGDMYYNGHGVAQDYSQAMSWYRKSADQGNAYAQASIGFMYENGQGVERDEGLAMSWYRKAGDQGNTSAKAALARLQAYAPGRLNVLFTDVVADEFENGHAGMCRLIANIHNNSKYHVDEMTFKIGTWNFKIDEISANSYLDQDKIGSVSLSDESAPCADQAIYLRNTIGNASIFKCSMPGIAEGDCQQMVNISTNIDDASVKRIRDTETALGQKQFAPVMAALNQAGIVAANVDPDAQKNQAKYSELLNAIVKLDAQSWSVNKYADGSMANVMLIDRDRSSATLKGSYSYQGGQRGWVKLKIFKDKPPCVEFWDFEGTCRSIHLATVSAAN